MANLLKASTREEIMRLLQVGWSHRQIAHELKVDRGTVSRYARSAPPSSSAPADRERWLSSREEHDPLVEQLRPLARVLLLQARRDIAARAVRRAADTTTRMGSARDRPADADQPASRL
jgi:IS30 family transposase